MIDLLFERLIDWLKIDLLKIDLLFERLIDWLIIGLLNDRLRL